MFKKKEETNSKTVEPLLILDDPKQNKEEPWRYSHENPLSSIKAQRDYVRFLRKVGTFFRFLNMFLLFLVLVLSVWFVFFSTPERLVFQDGTLFGCIKLPSELIDD